MAKGVKPTAKKPEDELDETEVGEPVEAKEPKESKEPKAPKALTATEERREKALDAALKQIEKNYGVGSIMRLAEDQVVRVTGIPTGALSLDLALGGQGMPRGRICELFGPEGSGKTTLALHVIASAQKLGGVAAFIDAEHAMDPTWARRLGVDLETAADLPAGHRRAGAGNLRDARPLQRRGRGGDRLGGGPDPAGGDRGRDGRLSTWASRPA